MSPEVRHAAGRAGKLRRGRWAFLAFAGIAAYFLLTEHRAHLSGLAYWLPFLFVLACPLLHVFMHGRHDHRHPRDTSGDEAANEPLR
jgi:hypothetical protein